MRRNTIDRVAIAASAAVLAAFLWFWGLQILAVVELLSLA